MAENIVSGLFGLDPYQIQQQQLEGINKFAANQAQLSAGQRAVQGMTEAGAGLGRIGAGMLGMVNPQIEQAKQREAILSQTDMQTPEGILKGAELARQRGDVKMQIQLQALARQRQEEIQQTGLISAKTRKEEMLAEEQPRLKHEEAMAAIAQRAEAAKMRSEDMRLNSQMRADALRESNELKRLMIATRAGGGAQKPKGLTREASLKWDLDAGLIDQATYDASISATPGAKLKAERVAAANSAETGFAAVERNIDTLYNPKTKSLTGAAKPLFGKYAQYRPELLQTQETVDANAALESLTNQVMMANLADAKTRVGQSFGSMQVQEWDKFTQQLTSLKRGLSESAAASSMEYVKNFIKTKRNILKTALGEGKMEQQPPAGMDLVGKTPDGKNVYQDSAGKRWVK